MLSLLQSAHASEIYKANDVGSFKSLSVHFATGEIEADQIVDSIPQIGVLILKNKTGKLSGWKHLGQPRIIQLKMPLVAAPKKLWGLKAIDVERAWAKTLGQGIVVAVSDTGVDADHPDLLENMWRNPREIQNGIDDDNNGYIDDVFGWDFVKKSPSGVDHHFHGTHVAGTIGARVSDKMAGVAPKAQIMDVSFLDHQGSGSEINGAKTIIYAADNGANIVNCSWGSTEHSQLIADAIRYAQGKGTLVVAAAGNDGVNTDKSVHSPSGEDVENIISVGSTAAAKGSRSSFSNYGIMSVDLAAPGSNIFSASPSGKTARYQTLSGTSMASPHAAGAAALVWSLNPAMTWREVKAVLMSTSVTNKYWKNKSVTGALMNVGRATE